MGSWQRVGVLLSLFASASVMAQQPSPRSAPLQNAARSQAAAMLHSALTGFLKDHDAVKAQGEFLAASARDPSYAPPFYELGLLAETQYDWPEAKRWFTKFCELDANSENSKRATQELQRLDRIAELEKTPEGRASRRYDETIIHGEVLLQLGLPKESIAEAAHAARIDDSRWEAYVVGAQALSVDGRFNEAEAFLRQALSRAAVADTSRLGNVAGIGGSGTRAEIQQAIQECQKEEDYQGLLKQAADQVQQQKYGAAAEDYRGALKDYPEREATALAYGDALAMSGVYDGAAKVFTDLRSSADPAIARHARESLTRLALRNIVSIPQTDADKLNQSAQAHAAQGNYPVAESEYKQAIKDEPKYWQWHSNLAGLYSKQSRWPEAAAEFAQAHLLEPTDTGTLTDLGAVLLQEQAWADAISVYRDAVRIEPSNALHHDNLGTSLYFANQHAQAVTEYQQAVKLDPANPTYRKHLATAQGQN